MFNLKRKEKKNSEKEKKLYLIRENARMEKWSSMIRNFDSFRLNNYKKLKDRTKKGIPDCLRGYVWYYFGNVQKYLNMEENKGLYEKLLYDTTINKETEDLIACDIDRTFPKHTFFKDKYGLG